MAFIRFIVTPAGRVLRVVAGVVLVANGFVVQGIGGIVISVVGVLAIATGAMNVSLLAQLFGADVRGKPRAPGTR
jgi:hypothetical protein